MKLCIQDPTWSNSLYLLEGILEACEGASSGAAAFAFASAGGVRLLLRDTLFISFLSHASFDLVVGVDAVTNEAALDALQDCMNEQDNLTVRVFLDKRIRSLFHPKTCWFRHRNRGRLLVGSGNMTAGGLRGNYEAFTVAQLGPSQQHELEETWGSWIESHGDQLLPLDHPDVRERASMNTGREVHNRTTPEPSDIIIEDSLGNLSVSSRHSASDAVLIAEIPKSGNRWNQSNFDLRTFKEFFGATPGHTQRIVLNHVDADGTVGPEEVRPSVSVSSHNFRFELDAAAGLLYPSRGRPIGIFVRVATRTFRYHLLMPGTKDHTRISKFLKRRCSVGPNRMRRIVTDMRALTGTSFARRS